MAAIVIQLFMPAQGWQVARENTSLFADTVTTTAYLHFFVYVDRAKTEQLRAQYESNFAAVVASMSPSIFYHISAMGPRSRQVVTELLPSPLPPNVRVDFLSPSTDGDLCRHRAAVASARSLLPGAPFDIYFFGNDGSRPVGLGSDGAWVEDFRALIHGGAALVGPTISCQASSPHVQTHFFALSADGLNQLDDLEGCDAVPGAPPRPHVELIGREVRLSAKILQSGGQIACLLPTYQHKSFTLPEWADLRTGSGKKFALF